MSLHGCACSGEWSPIMVRKETLSIGWERETFDWVEWHIKLSWTSSSFVHCQCLQELLIRLNSLHILEPSWHWSGPAQKTEKIESIGLIFDRNFSSQNWTESIDTHSYYWFVQLCIALYQTLHNFLFKILFIHRWGDSNPQLPIKELPIKEGDSNPTLLPTRRMLVKKVKRDHRVLAFFFSPLIPHSLVLFGKFFHAHHFAQDASQKL